MRIALASSPSVARTMSSPFASAAFVKFVEWQSSQTALIRLRSAANEASVRRAMSRSRNFSSRSVGLPSASSTPSACRIVAWSARHSESSGSGSRTPKNPQAVRTS